MKLINVQCTMYMYNKYINVNVPCKDESNRSKYDLNVEETNKQTKKF